jgi:hypothetical protein
MKFLALILTYLLFINTALAGLPPTTLKAQDGAKSTTFNFEVPHKQATKTATGGRVETGNPNKLENQGFEHSTVSTGWSTSVTGTATATLTAESPSVFKEGNQSLNFACAGGASGGTCLLYQDVNSVAIQGLVKALIQSDTASGVKFYTRVDGVNNLSKDIVSTLPDTLRTPQTMGSTSTGIGVLVTVAASQTINVDVDEAFVGPQSLLTEVPTCNGAIGCETVFSAYVADGSATTTVSKENLDWISGNCTNASAGNYVCTFKSGVFTTAPNCVATTDTGSSLEQDCGAFESATDVTLQCHNNNALADRSFRLMCQRTGADYIAATATSPGFSTTNANTDWAACTPGSGTQGWGTSPTYAFECKRDGGDLLMKGRLTVGTTPTAVEARVGLPIWNGATLTAAGTGKISAIQTAGSVGYNQSATLSLYSLIEPSVTYFTIGKQSGTSNGLAKINANSFVAGEIVSFEPVRIPINNWDNSNVIIGSFKEMMAVPGVSKPKTCFVQIGGAGSAASPTACTTGTCTEYLDTCGTASVTWSSTGVYDVVFASGTFANNSSYECSCRTAGICSFNAGGANFLSVNSSGGLSQRFTLTNSSGTLALNNGYAGLTCTGQAP